jgi:hypothetical protein
MDIKEKERIVLWLKSQITNVMSYLQSSPPLPFPPLGPLPTFTETNQESEHESSEKLN